MFKIFKPKQAERLPSDIQLERVIQMLFPALQIQADENGDEYYVDSSVDMNLDAALIDLEEGFNDDVCRTTIRKVANRLFEVRKFLNASNEINTTVERIVVKDVDTKKDIDDI